MIDPSDVDPRLLDAVTPVVDELTTHAGADPASILLVGAACRDVLHAGLGHTFPARATTDTDLGIAVADGTMSRRIEEAFPRIGSSGIRYRIAGSPVDIMPFGDIEDPEGITRPTARGEELVVFGFRDVHDRSMRLPLPSGSTICLPQPAGYAALKMRAWIDRSMFHGGDKDAKDLALAAFWYGESPNVQDRLYETDAGFDVLTEVGMDVELAAARLLALDAAAQLSPTNRDDLRRRWAGQDMTSLARDFVLPAAAPRPLSARRRRELVAQLRL